MRRFAGRVTKSVIAYYRTSDEPAPQWMRSHRRLVSLAAVVVFIGCGLSMSLLVDTYGPLLGFVVWLLVYLLIQVPTDNALRRVIGRRRRWKRIK